MGDGPFLAGPRPTLADLHAALMFDRFVAAPEGRTLLAGRPRWERVTARPSVAATAPP